MTSTKVSTGKSVAPVSDKAKAEAAKVRAQVTGQARPDWLTPAKARDGKFRDLDAGAAWVKRLKGIADDATKGALYDAGLFVHGVLAAGNVGKGKAYATQKELGRAIGYRESDMSKLKVIGRGVAVHGVAKGTHAYTALASYPGKAVTAAVALDDSAKVRQMLTGFYAEVQEHGRITQGATAAPRLESGTGEHNAPTPAGQSTPGATPVEGAEPSAPVDYLKVAADALKAYDAALKAVPKGKMTAEVWASHEDRLDAIRKREATHLRDIAAKAAKATPATVAKAKAKSGVTILPDAPKATATA